MADATEPDGISPSSCRHRNRYSKKHHSAGSGTGRWHARLVGGVCGTRLGVEPAAKMRATHEAKPHPAYCALRARSNESIPQRWTADLGHVQVMAQPRDGPERLREIRRVLKSEGNFASANQTPRENREELLLPAIFPALVPSMAAAHLLATRWSAGKVIITVVGRKPQSGMPQPPPRTSTKRRAADLLRLDMHRRRSFHEASRTS